MQIQENMQEAVDADSSEDKSWGVKGVEKDFSYRW